MKITYDNWLTVKEANILKNAGWTLHLFTNSEFKTRGIAPDGTFQGALAMSAEKEFKTPAEAMFEIEELLQIDVISETDQYGCPLHIFVWKNQNDGSDEVALGWDCAQEMFDAPDSPRKAAMELKHLRAKI
jgi:hypothetical protein